MTRKQYKKMMRIATIVLTVVNVAFLCWLMILKDNTAIQQSELTNLKYESTGLDEELENAQARLETVKEEKYLEMKELENWQRQNQKLEDMLH